MNLDELARQLSGRLLRRSGELDAYARDFGRTGTRTPRAVVRCGSSEDVEHTLRFARESSLPVTVRGSGCSARGQTLTSGIVLVPPRTPPIHSMADGTAELAAGARWADVVPALAAHGRAIPVLPTYLETTVGGTLSVGGYGPRSIRLGNQLDHVRSARLIRADGTATWISPDHEPETFSLALGTLGQLGVLDRVVVRTCPPRHPTLYGAEHPSLARLAEWLTTAPPADAFLGFSSREDLLAGRAGVQVAMDQDGPPPRMERITSTRGLDADVRTWAAGLRRHVRLFTDLVVTAEGLESLATWIDTRLDATPDLRGVLVLAAPNHADFPFDGRTGDTTMAYGLGLYLAVPDGRPDRRAAAEAFLAEATDRCLAEGGRPYLWGWHHLSSNDLRRVYGAAYDRMLAIRARTDPLGLLNAGSL